MSTKSAEWGRAALDACLRNLAVSKVTLGQTVTVLDSWTEASVAFCVVYRYPYFDGVLGIRRTFDEDMYGNEPNDPEAYGCDVADFDIGEPLGTVVHGLRVDDDGVHWWGDLDAALPRKPG